MRKQISLIASLLTLRAETKTRGVFEVFHRPELIFLNDIQIPWERTTIECLTVYAKR